MQPIRETELAYATSNKDLGQASVTAPAQAGSVLPDGQTSPHDRAESISMLSHDIRGAISDVIGGLRLIDASGLDPALRAQLDRVRSSGEALARLLEDAFSGLVEEDLARPPSAANLNLQRFLHDLQMRWSGRALSNGLQFTLTAPDSLPAVIFTDRTALDRILGNLLGNAIKYADTQGVALRVDMVDGEDLRLRVTDDGPGFSDAALAQLFQYAGRPEGSSRPGSGLGLHIAKDLADRIGGRLSVNNGASGGAEVTLILPHAAWYPPHGGLVEGNEALADLTGARILVAEDNETNQILTAQMLENLGAEYAIAADGIEALNLLEREDFDLALIDIEMPRLNGIDVIRAIRAGPEPGAQMPLIALTAYVLKANREAIFAAGADGIIAKPIMSISTFGRALRDHLDRAPQDAAAAATEDWLPDPEGPVLDCARMGQLLDIAGPEARLELLDRLQADLARVRAGLARAVPKADHAAVRAESHVLISLAGAIGAAPLHRYAVALNRAAHRGDGSQLVPLVETADTMIEDLLGRLARKHAAMGEMQA